jgi:ubiquinone/menaquinone biosynthesis C-methylase UbiE
VTDFLAPGLDAGDPAFASAFDELSFWSSRFGTLLFRHLDLAPDLRILDLGCGTGVPLLELAHVHGESCRLVGVDVWTQALARAETKRRAHRLARVRLVQADGAALPFAGARFDLIVSGLGVNNFADPGAVLAECARVARRAARLVLTTNLEGHLREFYAAYRDTLEALGLTRHLPRLEANERHRGTVESVSRLCEEAGFRVTRRIEDRFTLRYLDGGALLRHPLTRYGFLEGWRRVVDPAEEATVFAALQRRLDDVARRDGELRMTVPMLYLEARRE